jgi:hypothetical protein
MGGLMKTHPRLARTAIGHAVAPPSSVMNSRRFSPRGTAKINDRPGGGKAAGGHEMAKKAAQALHRQEVEGRSVS